MWSLGHKMVTDSKLYAHNSGWNDVPAEGVGCRSGLEGRIGCRSGWNDVTAIPSEMCNRKIGSVLFVTNG